MVSHQYISLSLNNKHYHPQLHVSNRKHPENNNNNNNNNNDSDNSSLISPLDDDVIIRYVLLYSQ